MENHSLYAYNRKANYEEFVTKPDKNHAVLGQFKDGICRSCVFGNGQGGLHCSGMEFDKESETLLSFLKSVDSYFNDPRMKTRRQSRDKSTVVIDETVFNPPLEWSEDEDWSMVKKIKSREIHTITMPMQLLRDVLTYEATNGKYLSYNALITAKKLTP